MSQGKLLHIHELQNWFRCCPFKHKEQLSAKVVVDGDRDEGKREGGGDRNPLSWPPRSWTTWTNRAWSVVVHRILGVPMDLLAGNLEKNLGPVPPPLLLLLLLLLILLLLLAKMWRWVEAWFWCKNGKKVGGCRYTGIPLIGFNIVTSLCHTSCLWMMVWSWHSWPGASDRSMLVPLLLQKPISWLWFGGLICKDKSGCGGKSSISYAIPILFPIISCHTLICCSWNKLLCLHYTAYLEDEVAMGERLEGWGVKCKVWELRFESEFKSAFYFLPVWWQIYIKTKD